jgi:hypothetical protein
MGEQATFIVALGAGNHTLTATYGGDSTYAASTASLSETVQRAGDIVTLGVSSLALSAHQPFTLTATVSPVLRRKATGETPVLRGRLIGQRRPPRRGLALAGADVLGSPRSVFLGRERVEIVGPTRVLEQLPQERHAPTAPRARAVALRQLARHARLLDADERQQFPPRDVEAVADFGVEVHVSLPE